MSASEPYQVENNPPSGYNKENKELRKGLAVKKLYLASILIILSFFLGTKYGKGEIKVPEKLPEFPVLQQNRQSAPTGVNWQVLWTAIDQINQKYVNRPADLNKILYGAVSGAVSALDDPYSVFLPPKEAEEFKNELSGNFEGIGAEIAIKNQQLVVVTPLDESPAKKSGLKPGDFIHKVDGQETKGLTLEEAVQKIRGPAGTKVKLSVFHKGETKISEIEITRTKIEVKSVTAEVRESGGKKIGYLKLRRFGEDTSGLVDGAIGQFLNNKISGLVIDVRSNPGGYLDAAVTISSNLVKEGEIIVSQKYGDGTEKVYRSERDPKLTRIPVIILINGGSASASEILAGALRDHGIAKLVGEKSFGKGSVQELIDLPENAQLKLTIAKWLTPKGHDLNKDGLEPDIKVELTDEDFQNDRDPQLDKAMELVTQ